MGHKEREIPQEPFKIRGHHLVLFSEILSGTPTKSLADDDEVVGMADRKFGTDYIKDVIGTTPEERAKFRETEEKAIKDFLSLPEDYPAELGTDKDVICKGCAVGKHCGTEEISKTDQAFLGDFLDVLKEKKVPFTSVGTESSPVRIRTTIGTVRTILRKELFYV